MFQLLLDKQLEEKKTAMTEYNNTKEKWKNFNKKNKNKNLSNKLKKEKKVLLEKEYSWKLKKDEIIAQIKLDCVSSKNAIITVKDLYKTDRSFAIKNYINQKNFAIYNVYNSSYDIEGPSIRNLMKYRMEIFNEVQQYLITHYVSSNVTKLEIQKICKNYGWIFILLNNIFSKVYTCEHEFNESLVSNLISKLELLQTYLIKFQFSFIQKIYMLLKYLVFQMWDLKGDRDMFESFIEIFY